MSRGGGAVVPWPIIPAGRGGGGPAAVHETGSGKNF